MDNVPETRFLSQITVKCSKTGEGGEKWRKREIFPARWKNGDKAANKRTPLFDLNVRKWKGLEKSVSGVERRWVKREFFVKAVEKEKARADARA